jgi:hypothetical protein
MKPQPSRRASIGGTSAMILRAVRRSGRGSSGSLAIFATIRRAYAIPNFFDTCARV